MAASAAFRRGSCGSSSFSGAAAAALRARTPPSSARAAAVAPRPRPGALPPRSPAAVGAGGVAAWASRSRAPRARDPLLSSAAARGEPIRLRALSSSSSSSSLPPAFPADDPEDNPEELAGLFKNPIVQQLWSARRRAKRAAASNRAIDASFASRPKPPADSRVSVTYPFKGDAYLREAYRNPWGQMRLGRLMEDLDALAGNIAFFHVVPSPPPSSTSSSSSPTSSGAAGSVPVAPSKNKAGTRGEKAAASEAAGAGKATAPPSSSEHQQPRHRHPVIVTASVDRIQLHRPSPEMREDQELSGCVTWTGTSSMEIRMQCRVCTEEDPWLVAYVTFVTLDPVTHRPTPIPPLAPATREEEAEFEAGSQRAAAKKQRRHRKKNPSAGGGKQPVAPSPYDGEVEALAESLLEEAGPLLTLPSLADPHSILMAQTRMQNAQIAQPQVQNLHSRIFGGFLLRRAFELGFANAYLFGGALPQFAEVDEVSFQSPVDVGDLLVFNSRVLYTEPDGSGGVGESGAEAGAASGGSRLPVVHVEVECWVTEPEKARARLSNQFYFTFAVRRAPLHADSSPSPSDGSGPALPSSRKIRKVLPSNIDEARRMAIRILGDREQQRQQ